MAYLFRSHTTKFHFVPRSNYSTAKPKITPFDFSSVYPNDKFTALSLSTMDKAVNEIPNGKQWLFNDGSAYSNNPIISLLIKNPEIVKMGHTGYTASWTLKTLRNIYALGWEKWSSEKQKGMFDN